MLEADVVKSGDFAVARDPDGQITHIMFVEELGNLSSGELKEGVTAVSALFHTMASKETLYGGSQETSS